MTMPIYASPEQFMRDRSEYARKGIARGRSVVVTTLLRRRAVRRGEPLAHAAQGQRDLRPDRVRRGRPVQRVREPAHRRHPAGRRARASPTTAGTSPVAGWPTPTRRPSARSSPSTRSRSRWSCAWPRSAAPAPAGSARAVGADQLYRISYDGSIVDERKFVVMGGVTEPVITALNASFTAGLGPADRTAVRGQRPRHRPARMRRASCCRRNSRWPCWTAPWPAGRSAGFRVRLAALLADPPHRARSVGDR